MMINFHRPTASAAAKQLHGANRPPSNNSYRKRTAFCVAIVCCVALIVLTSQVGHVARVEQLDAARPHKMTSVAGSPSESDKWAALVAIPVLTEAGAQAAISATPAAPAGVEPSPLRAPALLRVRDVFIAYGGVVCLVFEGFPAPLLRLKTELDAQGRSAFGAAWPPENAGSKWAKVTLAAFDSTELAAGGPALDPAQLAPRLRALCLSYRERLSRIALPVRAVTLVRFQSRDLATRVEERVLPVPEVPVSEAAEVSNATRAFTDEVVDEFFNEANTAPYLGAHFGDRRVGSSRYTEILPTPQHTLVIDLKNTDAREFEDLQRVLKDFKADLSKLFGSDILWKWFDAAAWHCTVRGL